MYSLITFIKWELWRCKGSVLSTDNLDRRTSLLSKHAKNYVKDFKGYTCKTW